MPPLSTAATDDDGLLIMLVRDHQYLYDKTFAVHKDGALPDNA